MSQSISNTEENVARGNQLCLMFSGRDGPSIARQAIRLAKEKKMRVCFAYVLDPTVADAVFHKLTDAVFVGERPTEQLAQAILAEHATRGRECLRRATEDAAASGVESEERLLAGEVVQSAHALAMECACAEIVLGEPRPSLLQHFFSHSIADHLRRLGCVVEVVKVGS
ncbi:MAG: hypothetical protein CO095_00770 [Armatimonadetes bacterium CG_4_9_14_3_um_filter_58_7]|nr:MAG: hypothetical protein CO095_00770 [Armatimonadetes bacterium CG_4_9_14_3_um_filter_58_7]